MSEEKVSLKELIFSKIADMEKATIIALQNLDKRLDGMNEFRDTLKDQASRFITRDEMNIKFDNIEKGRKDNLAMWISLGAILVSILLHFWK